MIKCIVSLVKHLRKYRIFATSLQRFSYVKIIEKISILIIFFQELEKSDNINLFAYFNICYDLSTLDESSYKTNFVFLNENRVGQVYL